MKLTTSAVLRGLLVTYFANSSRVGVSSMRQTSGPTVAVMLRACLANTAFPWGMSPTA